MSPDLAPEDLTKIQSIMSDLSSKINSGDYGAVWSIFAPNPTVTAKNDLLGGAVEKIASKEGNLSSRFHRAIISLRYLNLRVLILFHDLTSQLWLPIISKTLSEELLPPKSIQVSVLSRSSRTGVEVDVS